MNHRKLLFATVGLMVLMSACRKESDVSTLPVEPIDSTTTPIHSKNCLDSILGTYYGYTNTKETRRENGVTTVTYQYIGPDTVRLANDFLAPGYFMFFSSKIQVNLHSKPKPVFKFDTTGHLKSVMSVYYNLDIYPNVDSVQYSVADGYVDINGVGEYIESYFNGRKRP